MFRGDAVRELVALFQRRNVWLFHACQLRDLRSYLQLGGIPARALLEAGGLPFTPFETDETDRWAGVWDNVFANLQDFGAPFANGHAWTPTTYGPIQLLILPDALLDAEDVAICLRSAGAQGFDRERESLRKLPDVERLFFKESGGGLKNAKKLREEFGLDNGSNPELSCTFPDGLLPRRHIKKCVVDPYTFDGKELLEVVRGVWTGAEGRVPKLAGRDVKEERQVVYQELACLIQAEPSISLLALATHPGASPATKEWARRCAAGRFEYQFARFRDYLMSGTIREV